jgi:hypothetical protein
MPRLKIINKVEFDSWLRDHIMMGNRVVSIKGPPPKGATYRDGTLIDRQVNVGWTVVATGETFEIRYETGENK